VRRSLGALFPVVLALSCNTPEASGPRPPVPTASPAPADPPAPEPSPGLRLPEGVTPTAEAVALTLDPTKEGYTGRVVIDLSVAAERRAIWLHGRDFKDVKAKVTREGSAPVEAVFEQRDPTGLASVTTASPIGPGKVRLEITFRADFAKGQKGLYKTTQGDASYAFTQFEATAARTAFPCFDEPRFKIPFAVSLTVPAGMKAVSNAREVSRSTAAGGETIVFAPTEKLPSYLVAFAVGPLDIVTAPDIPASAVRPHPIPLRAITAKGRGKEVRYALDHTGEILQKIEAYAGIAYPYDKLDILAVPGKGGAMENAGAVTFGEFFLLFDPKTAPVRQRRAYAQVMAHELAHMWVGDLVTMQWWDDLWLNEAFATWLGSKTADQWDPTVRGELYLLQGIQNAMGTDGLVSARAIRQTIQSMDDIENAFDGITYQKGGGVIAMFERWVGPDAWRRGFSSYLSKHRHGNATADDLLDEENTASGKDVKKAFHTFLDQVGVPFVEAALSCGQDDKGPAAVTLAQSRFLPLGSTGDAEKTWQIPVCIRYGKGKTTAESCTLLSEKKATFPLADSANGCPDWIFPNAEAAGYYRFALPPADLARLKKAGLGALSMREKTAFANSVRAAYGRGVTPFGAAMEALAPLATEPDPNLAGEPMGILSQARDWLHAEPVRSDIEAYGRALYGDIGKRLGWDPKKGEDEETNVLRSSVLGFLVDNARDPAARREAKKRGLAYVGAGKDWQVHPEAVSPDLAGTAMAVLGEELDEKSWDALYKLLGTTVEEGTRGRILYALASARGPLLERARRLVLDPSLRDNEVLTPLFAQLNDNDTSEATWKWVKDHYDEITARLPKHHGGVALISAASSFCDEAHAADAEAFFKPKVASIEGGPRALALAIEGVKLCAARRKAQEASVRAFFEQKKPRGAKGR